MSHHEAGIDISLSLSPSKTCRRDGGRRVAVRGGQNYILIPQGTLSIWRAQTQATSTDALQNISIFSARQLLSNLTSSSREKQPTGKTSGNSAKASETLGDGGGEKPDPVSWRNGEFTRREMRREPLWSLLPLMRTLDSNLGLHCKRWKFKVGFRWKIPL